jgi:hypothetical protein
VHLTEVGQHPSRDADGSCREGGANEDGRHCEIGRAFTRGVRQVRPIREAQEEREDYAHSGYRERRRSYAEHLLEISLQPNLEEQEYYPELRQHVNYFGPNSLGWNEAKYAPPQDDPTDQLTQHGWLAESFGKLSQELGSHKHRRKDKEQAGNRELLHRLERFLGAGTQGEGVFEQREIHLIGVLGLDDDSAGVVVAGDLEVWLWTVLEQ